MAKHELIQWAHKYALTIDDKPSLNHARDGLMKDLRDDVDMYVLISPDAEYCPMFADAIRDSLEALQLVARGLARYE